MRGVEFTGQRPPRSAEDTGFGVCGQVGATNTDDLHPMSVLEQMVRLAGQGVGSCLSTLGGQEPTLSSTPLSRKLPRKDGTTWDGAGKISIVSVELCPPKSIF